MPVQAHNVPLELIIVRRPQRYRFVVLGGLTTVSGVIKVCKLANLIQNPLSIKPTTFLVPLNHLSKSISTNRKSDAPRKLTAIAPRGVSNWGGVAFGGKAAPLQFTKVGSTASKLSILYFDLSWDMERLTYGRLQAHEPHANQQSPLAAWARRYPVVSPPEIKYKRNREERHPKASTCM
jgi:hypothetical protein